MLQREGDLPFAGIDRKPGNLRDVVTERVYRYPLEQVVAEKFHGGFGYAGYDRRIDVGACVIIPVLAELGEEHHIRGLVVDEADRVRGLEKPVFLIIAVIGAEHDRIFAVQPGHGAVNGPQLGLVCRILGRVGHLCLRDGFGILLILVAEEPEGDEFFIPVHYGEIVDGVVIVLRAGDHDDGIDKVFDRRKERALYGVCQHVDRVAPLKADVVSVVRQELMPHAHGVGVSGGVRDSPRCRRLKQPVFAVPVGVVRDLQLGKRITAGGDKLRKKLQIVGYALVTAYLEFAVVVTVKFKAAVFVCDGDGLKLVP